MTFRTLPIALVAALVSALVVGVGAAAHARDLLILEAGGLRDSGNDVRGLLEDFLDQKGAFAGLELQPSYSMTLDYLGIANAITAQAALGGASLVLAFPITGFSKTFVGATNEDVEDQVEDFFETREGGKELAKFLEKTNARTPLATLDGNPRATTALLARGAFDRFGLHPARSRAGYREEQVAEWGHVDLRLAGGGGVVDVDDFDSLYVGDAALTLGGDFEPGVGLYFTLLGQYRSYDGASIYDAGAELAIPIALLRPGENSALRWTLTPFGQTGAGISLDLLSGGFFAGGGGVNALSYDLGPIELGIANEIVYYAGIPLGEIDDIEVETELDQLIARNGGKLALHPEGCDWFSAEIGVSFTNFLASSAKVDFYTSPFAGVEFRPFEGLLKLRLGWESDLGPKYAAHLGRVELALEF